ncbi:DUF4145 domain-containing protein [Leptospira venezuelensis]|uniref:DUF4145 domain-containing protein n=1 Tax=Leptospira venezuelensis TaxID=1958811 RepID=UPI00142D518A|nr:DUF4145 domain-containing protein [Leptospira venezuelensis]
MSKFIPPQFKLRAYSCPVCGAFANMQWSETTSTLGPYRSERTPIYLARCAHCYEDNYWFTQVNEENVVINSIMIIPDGSRAPLPHPYMPENVKKDYMEARSIINISSKGACALLRLSIQKLCVHLGEPGKDLNSDIGNLVSKGLPVEVQQALDIVRVIGNKAVHPGELNEEDIEEVALPLFDLVNEIIEDRISKPQKLKSLFERLPKNSKEQIEKRDNTNKK